MAKIGEETTAPDFALVVVGPDDARAFQEFWRWEGLPFVWLADPSHRVAGRYGQEVKLLQAGRMPALLVVDKAGRVAYTHYGGSMADIPASSEILAVLDELNDTAPSS